MFICAGLSFQLGPRPEGRLPLLEVGRRLVPLMGVDADNRLGSALGCVTPFQTLGGGQSKRQAAALAQQHTRSRAGDDPLVPDTASQLFG